MKAKFLYGALAALLAAGFMFGAMAETETDDARVYTMMDENGVKITSKRGKMYEGDEYISGDNRLYRVVSVEEGSAVATARFVGMEAEEAVQVSGAFQGGNNLILMYSTHSDESYIPGDGDYSLEKDAGIYDVGEAFKGHLEKEGLNVEYSRETFLPHDAGAYRRSRAVAQEYAQRMPLAIIDIHRDGIPKEEYETTVEGEKTSMVRLFVGKSNANARENRAFAKKLKAIADEEYPGLIKDIYIGKGNYNQDLYPRAILLEFGTHEMEKQRVIDSTEYMAKVVSAAVGNEKGAAPKETKEEKKGAVSGVAVLVGAAAVGCIVFALAASGSFRGAGRRIKKSAGEMTGGLFTDKKKDGK